MRKPAWIGRRVMQATPWRHWLFALITVSVLGTLLAGIALAFDGWVDAFALYVACVLMLALMLSHFEGQRRQPRLAPLADDGGAGSGGCPTGLALAVTPRPWAGTDHVGLPPVLSSASPTD